MILINSRERHLVPSATDFHRNIKGFSPLGSAPGSARGGLFAAAGAKWMGAASAGAGGSGAAPEGKGRGAAGRGKGLAAAGRGAAGVLAPCRPRREWGESWFDPGLGVEKEESDRQ